MCGGHRRGWRAGRVPWCLPPGLGWAQSPHKGGGSPVPSRTDSMSGEKPAESTGKLHSCLRNQWHRLLLPKRSHPFHNGFRPWDRGHGGGRKEGKPGCWVGGAEGQQRCLSCSPTSGTQHPAPRTQHREQGARLGLTVQPTVSSSTLRGQEAVRKWGGEGETSREPLAVPSSHQAQHPAWPQGLSPAPAHRGFADRWKAQ